MLVVAGESRPTDRVLLWPMAHRAATQARLPMIEVGKMLRIVLMDQATARARQKNMLSNPCNWALPGVA